MTKEEIENHAAWKYISNLSGQSRYNALFISMKNQTESFFDVTIEEWPFTRLSEIPNECLYISCTDPFRNVSLIAVLIPNKQLKV